MRLLVTGGAGTLGTHVIRHLYDLAENIFVIDNFATSDRSSLDNLQKVRIFEGSVSSKDLVKSVFQSSNPTHVIHLAASYRNPDDWDEDISTNIVGMINLVREAQTTGIEKFINIQTVLCYGRPDTLPIPVDAPLKPESSYAISKVAAESFLINSNLPFVSLRLGSVISPGLSIGPIPNFFKNIQSGLPSKVTKSVRDFLDLDDFLAAFDLVLDKSSPNGIFNISSGRGVSMLEIHDGMSNLLGGKIVPEILDPQADDIPAIVLDPGEASAVLGWVAKVPLRESLNKCIESYKRDGIGEIFTHLRKEQG
jgi:nucleoside-diphosphate-sugar epimerase